MKFEIGKYYKHSGGGMMHIVGSAKTTMYGWCLVAEEAGRGMHTGLRPMGTDEVSAQNWTETTEKEWRSNFS